MAKPCDCRWGACAKLYVRAAMADLNLVAVQVMQIRHMCMAMAGRLMPMQMAVRPNRHRVMHMVVMAIVVAVRVFVLHRVVLMFMGMGFGKVHQDTDQHQNATEREAPTARAITQHEGQGGTDERRKGKHRPRPSRPKGSLRQEVEA